MSLGLYASFFTGFGATLTVAGIFISKFRWALDRRYVMILGIFPGIHEVLAIENGRGLTLLSLSFVLLIAASTLRNLPPEM